MTDREDWLARTILDLTDVLDPGTDEGAYSQGLIARLTELLALAEVGLLIADNTGRLRAVAASGEHAGDLASIDANQGNGPGSYAYRTGQFVLNDALAGAHGPWPRYAATARAAGYHAVTAFPVRRRDEIIGAVCALTRDSNRLTADDVRIAAIIAEAAAIGIIQHRMFHENAGAVHQIRADLEQRALAEQAKGAVAAWLGIGIDAAARRMLAYASEHDLAIADVAERILRGELPVRELSR